MSDIKAFIFDLDDTLTESKMSLDKQMAVRIGWALQKYAVGIISGCSYNQFKKQFVKPFIEMIDDLVCPNLYLMPASGIQMYSYVHGQWTRRYHDDLILREKAEIYNAFVQAAAQSGIKPLEEPHGEIGEDRESQITFSMCGQEAPSDVKKPWDTDQSKRLALSACMDELLGKKYTITVGGASSIDVSRLNQDKAYGVRKFLEFKGLSPEDAVFIGDALFEGGNDYPVLSTGVRCVETSGPDETLRIIDNLLGNV